MVGFAIYISHAFDRAAPTGGNRTRSNSPTIPERILDSPVRYL
jgi:hypothetical protein